MCSLQNERERRDQSLQLFELFIDLIHGDLVSGDTACRRVADAIISTYENAIRWLVTHETTFTPALKGAINTYCARHVLRHAPELLITSEETATAYEQIAALLAETDGMTHVGEAMVEELSRLRCRLETRRFARLLELMGHAVVLYMQQASRQHNEESSVNVPLSNEEEPSFWSRLAKFDGTSAQTVCSFNEKKELDCKDATCESNNISQESPLRGLAEEMYLAMHTPVKSHTAPCMSTRFLACARQQSQSQSTCIASTQTEEAPGEIKEPVITGGRPMFQSNDSELAAVNNVENRCFQTLHDTTSSLLVAENSDLSFAVTTKPPRKDFFLASDVDENDTALLGGDVQVRSYFLCAKTNRYEPEGARGFFI